MKDISRCRDRMGACLKDGVPIRAQNEHANEFFYVVVRKSVVSLAELYQLQHRSFFLLMLRCMTVTILMIDVGVFHLTRFPSRWGAQMNVLAFLIELLL